MLIQILQQSLLLFFMRSSNFYGTFSPKVSASEFSSFPPQAVQGKIKASSTV